MADTIVSKSKIDAIVDVLNSKSGDTETLTLDQIASKIDTEYVNMTQICDGSAFEGNVVLKNVYHSQDEKTVCVPDHRFRGTNITELTVDEQNDFYFGGYSFYGCYKLTTINAPNCINVSSYAFYGCNSLKKINIPKLQRVGSYAFYDSKFEEIETPNITSLSSSAFKRCRSLISINMPLVKTLPTDTFTECASLTNVITPALTQIGQSAFSSSGLTSFTTHVNDIGVGAFGYCSKLQIFEATATKAGSLRSSLFQYCESLDTVILRSLDMWQNDSTYVFYKSKIASGGGFIYVPKDLIETYKVATNWVAYADYFRALEDYTTDGTITGPLDETKI